MKSRARLIWPLCGLACLSASPAALGQSSAESAVRPQLLVPAQRFRFDAGAPLLAPAGVAADGTLCVGTVDGYVHALNGDGSYRWSYTVHGAVNRRPLHVGELWYIATSAERIYALTAEGTLYWVFKPLSPVNSELAADASGTLYFVAADHFLYGVSGHGGVSLRAAFGEPKSGPIAAPDGAIWAENQLGIVIRARGPELRRFATNEQPEFQFSDPALLHDPDGHEWRGRSDGVLEFSAGVGSSPSLYPLTSSALFAPVWSSASHYAVLSARSGLVFALDPVPLRASR